MSEFHRGADNERGDFDADVDNAAEDAEAEQRKVARVDYKIKVYVMRTWPTGTPRGTGVRTFTVSEDASILGGMRAIDRAVEQCDGRAMVDVHAPEITPNPALEGWPVSL